MKPQYSLHPYHTNIIGSCHVCMISSQDFSLTWNSMLIDCKAYLTCILNFATSGTLLNVCTRHVSRMQLMHLGRACHTALGGSIRRLLATQKLNNGLEMPLFGIGTWKSKAGGPLETSLRTAFESGYRCTTSPSGCLAGRKQQRHAYWQTKIAACTSSAGHLTGSNLFSVRLA